MCLPCRFPCSELSLPTPRAPEFLAPFFCQDCCQRQATNTIHAFNRGSWRRVGIEKNSLTRENTPKHFDLMGFLSSLSHKGGFACLKACFFGISTDVSHGARWNSANCLPSVSVSAELTIRQFPSITWPRSKECVSVCDCVRASVPFYMHINSLCDVG